MIENSKTSQAQYTCQIANIEILELVMDSSRLEKGWAYQFFYEVQLEHKAGMENDFLYVVTSVKVLDETQTLEIGRVKISCVFEIESIMQFFDPNIGQLDLPVSMQLEINAAAISTTRGVMFSHFRGTFLQQAILPLIDPGNFVMRPLKG